MGDQIRIRFLFSRELFFYPKKLFIHSTTISKFESKNSQEYHVVCNGATNRPVEKGLLICTGEYFKSRNFSFLKYSQVQIYHFQIERGRPYDYLVITKHKKIRVGSLYLSMIIALNFTPRHGHFISFTSPAATLFFISLADEEEFLEYYTFPWFLLWILLRDMGISYHLLLRQTHCFSYRLLTRKNFTSIIPSGLRFLSRSFRL